MTRRAWIVIAPLALAATGCGGDETRYNDDKIAERLHLEKTENAYAIDGDPFCQVEQKLLNDSSEVVDAADKDKIGIVVSSREGNVGVKGVVPFAHDCAETAKKRLDKLDPQPKD
jgi:hypothetical protein